jgi:hypothetical protein
MSDISPRDVLDFWFKETPSEKWFSNDPMLDAQIRSRFESTWRRGCAGELNDWENEPNGALALIVLFDQFPRNMFRGTAEAFASDPLAREVAKRAIAGEARSRSSHRVPQLLLFAARALGESLLIRTPACSSRESGSASRTSLIAMRSCTSGGGTLWPVPGAEQGARTCDSTPEEQEFLNKNPRGF